MNGAVRPRHLSFGVHRDSCALSYYVLLGWGVKRPGLALTTHLCLMSCWDINLCDFCAPTSRWVLFKLRGIRDVYLQALDTVVIGEWCRRVAGGRWHTLQRSVRSVFVDPSNTDGSWMCLEFSVRIAVTDRPEGGGSSKKSVATRQLGVYSADLYLNHRRCKTLTSRGGI